LRNAARALASLRSSRALGSQLLGRLACHHLPFLATEKEDIMPIPRRIRRWNKVGLNRATVRLAPRLPGLGVVVHRGRRSGRVYQTPVNVFPAQDGYVLALTYGADTDWVKNVLAEGGCELRTRGRLMRLTSPRLFHDEQRAGIRPLERQILRAIGVADFLSLKTASADAAMSGDATESAG